MQQSVLHIHILLYHTIPDHGSPHTFNRVTVRDKRRLLFLGNSGELERSGGWRRALLPGGRRRGRERRRERGREQGREAHGGYEARSEGQGREGARQELEEQSKDWKARGEGLELNRGMLQTRHKLCCNCCVVLSALSETSRDTPAAYRSHVAAV